MFEKVAHADYSGRDLLYWLTEEKDLRV